MSEQESYWPITLRVDYIEFISKAHKADVIYSVNSMTPVTLKKRSLSHDLLSHNLLDGRVSERAKMRGQATKSFGAYKRNLLIISA